MRGVEFLVLGLSKASRSARRLRRRKNMVPSSTTSASSASRSAPTARRYPQCSNQRRRRPCPLSSTSGHGRRAAEVAVLERVEFCAPGFLRDVRWRDISPAACAPARARDSSHWPSELLRRVCSSRRSPARAPLLWLLHHGHRLLPPRRPSPRIATCSRREKGEEGRRGKKRGGGVPDIGAHGSHLDSTSPPHQTKSGSKPPKDLK